MWREMKNWAENQNWQCEPRRLSGVYRGYQFTVLGYDGARFRVVTPVPRLGDEARGQLARFFAGAKKPLRVEEYSLENDLCVAKIRDAVASGSDKVLVAYLDALTGELAAAGVPGRDHCGICGNPGQHRLAWLSGISLPVCDECFHSIEAAQQQIADEATTPRNYGAGLIGALLGALVGAVPWVVVNRLGYVASILGALIGVASMAGYTRFGGKHGRATAWIIGFCTLFAVVAAELVSVAMMFVKNDIEVLASNFVIFYTHPDLAPQAWGDLGVALFMAGLGLYGIIVRLAKSGRVEPISRADASA